MTIFNDLFGIPNKGGGGRGTVNSSSSTVTPAAAPSVSPKAAEVTAATVAAAPAAASPTTPTPPTPNPTPGFFDSVMSIIDGAVQPNALNRFYQSTYHFRLFVAPDTDFMSQAAQPLTSGESGAKMQTIQEFNSKLSQIKKIILAESGVTGFNIKDVQITTVPAGTTQTRTDVGTTGTITITEPNGISFLDGLQAAGAELRILNYLKCSYYLELTFLGYDENGHFVGSLSDTDDFKSGGRWTWEITFSNIDVKLTEGGGVYTISFQCGNHAVSIIDDGKHDIMRVPQAFKAEGATVGALYADYIKQLNASWVSYNGGVLVQFDGINTQEVGKFFAHPPTASSKDPGTFKMAPPEPEKNPNRSWKFDSKSGSYLVNVTTGYRVQDFIIDAIKHSVEGQALAKDDSNVATQTDKTCCTINERGHRESIIWSVEIAVTQTTFDTTSYHYIKHIVFYVIPHYSQAAVLTPTQVEQAATNAVQRGKVQAMVDNGMLRKRYDYVFTGLNTEIIDFDMSFTTNYDFLNSAFAGTQMRYDAFAQGERLHDTGSAVVAGNADESHTKVTAVPCKTPTPAPAAPPTAVASTIGSQAAGGRGSGSHLNNTVRTISSVVTAIPGKSAIARPQVTAANTACPPTPVAGPAQPATIVDTSGLNEFYVEDLLSQQTATNPSDFAIPISFWKTNKIAENESGNLGWSGQYNRDQSAVGAIWAQIYGSSQKTGAYQSINLTLRGDPYWLGQTNIHRQINLVAGNFSVAGNDLPDWSSGHQSFYLHFRFPLQIGDDFKPAMRTSQSYNGIYRLTTITHTFSDGVFKQELKNCPRDSLIDPSKWSATSGATNGGDGSSPTLTRPTTASKPLHSSGTYVQQAPIVVQKLMADFGLTQAQAAGIVGNLGAESGLQGINEKNPTVIGSLGGFGWAQWTGPRRTAFNTYVQNNNLDPTSSDANYGFLRQELSTDYASSITKIKQTSTVADATASFEKSYEGAGIVNMSGRVNFANTADTLTTAALSSTS